MGIPVSYRIGKTIVAALVLNLSRGGIAIRTSKPPVRGTAIKLKFALPGAKRELEAEGVVCWSHEKAGMGVQFSAIKATDQATIDGFRRGALLPIGRRSSPSVNLRRRTAFATTSAEAPVSASTAIHNVATPDTARIMNAALSPIEIATLTRMFRTRGVAEANRVGHLRQFIGHQRDVGGFERSIAAHGAHHDADVGRRQGGRVVDAVADHRDRAVGAAQELDRRHLVRRQLTGAHVVNAQ